MAQALNEVTPLILTYNEENNIARTLRALNWASRIVVIDSGSSDNTLSILSSVPRVELFYRKFDTHAHQWNYGLSQITSTWVLTLDADYVVSRELVEEIKSSLCAKDQTSIGYLVSFRYCVAGQPLRGTILPPRIALFKRQFGYYYDDGHTQDLLIDGTISRLTQPIFHDDRKPLDRWLWAQQRYMKRETDKLLSTPNHELSFADKVRKNTILAPLLILLICLFQKRAVLDGWRGLYYALQRTYAELLLLLMLYENRIDSLAE